MSGDWSVEDWRTWVDLATGVVTFAVAALGLYKAAAAHSGATEAKEQAELAKGEAEKTQFLVKSVHSQVLALHQQFSLHVHMTVHQGGTAEVRSQSSDDHLQPQRPSRLEHPACTSGLQVSPEE